jgi:hypothetical protein
MKNRKCEDCEWFEIPSYLLFYDAKELDAFTEKGMSENDVEAELKSEFEMGECHRFPPSTSSGAEAYENDRSCYVYRDWWCGEFHAKEDRVTIAITGLRREDYE